MDYIANGRDVGNFVVSGQAAIAQKIRIADIAPIFFQTMPPDFAAPASVAQMLGALAMLQQPDALNGRKLGKFTPKSGYYTDGLMRVMAHQPDQVRRCQRAARRWQIACL
jgi:hypothetical protein